MFRSRFHGTRGKPCDTILHILKLNGSICKCRSQFTIQESFGFTLLTDSYKIQSLSVHCTWTLTDASGLKWSPVRRVWSVCWSFIFVHACSRAMWLLSHELQFINTVTLSDIMSNTSCIKCHRVARGWWINQGVDWRECKTRCWINSAKRSRSSVLLWDVTAAGVQLINGKHGRIESCKRSLVFGSRPSSSVELKRLKQSWTASQSFLHSDGCNETKCWQTECQTCRNKLQRLWFGCRPYCETI